MTHIVQSVLLRKEHFTLSQAKQWLTKHGYSYHKLHETPTYYRFRQADPQLVHLGYRPRTISLGNIGSLVIFYH